MPKPDYRLEDLVGRTVVDVVHNDSDDVVIIEFEHGLKIKFQSVNLDYGDAVLSFEITSSHS